MKKYSRELINRYINSEDITIYDIDELENDKDFMMQVISVSGDNNFYNLCSDNVKCDYEFVKYLIIKFKHKIDFVCEVADYFLSHVGKELETTEIYTIMFEITKGNKSLNKKYFLVPLAKYDKEKLIIELYKRSEEDKEILEYFGMGFCYIYAEYKGYEETLNYFAKRMINDIIHENNKSLEDMLHKQFKTKDEVSRTKLNSFYISFIEKYDSSLASYTCVHLNILDEVNKGATMGMNAISYVSDKVTDAKFKNVLDTEYNKYKDISNRVNDLYANYSSKEPHETNAMTKMMTWYGIQMKTMNDDSTSKLSELLMQGTNMGIIEGRRLLNQNENAATDVKNILNDFVVMQEDSVETFKKYL